MLFFFELFLFVLVMLTLALGEFVSRWLAVVLWLVVTAFSLVGYALARQSLRSIIAGETALAPQPPRPAEGEAAADDEPRSVGSTPAGAEVSPLDEKWARTLLYNWRRANWLLLLGAVAVIGWNWLGG